MAPRQAGTGRQQVPRTEDGHRQHRFAGLAGHDERSQLEPAQARLGAEPAFGEKDEPVAGPGQAGQLGQDGPHRRPVSAVVDAYERGAQAPEERPRDRVRGQVAAGHEHDRFREHSYQSKGVQDALVVGHDHQRLAWRRRLAHGFQGDAQAKREGMYGGPGGPPPPVGPGQAHDQQPAGSRHQAHDAPSGGAIEDLGQTRGPPPVHSFTFIRRVPSRGCSPSGAAIPPGHRASLAPARFAMPSARFPLPCGRFRHARWSESYARCPRCPSVPVDQAGGEIVPSGRHCRFWAALLSISRLFHAQVRLARPERRP